MDRANIKEFYRNRSVLVTGGTGFMGKVLIEKLLRSCSDIDRVYVLTREKNGGTIDDRIQEITDTLIFSSLKDTDAHQLKKLVPVNGDVSLPGLGLTAEDRKILKTCISVIFHVAARIKFDRNIKAAVDVNVKGTRHVLQLASEIPNLEALVYVSTAYVHPEKTKLKEKIYTAPIEPQKLIDAVDSLKPKQLEKLLDRLLENCPNVYSISKAVAEHLIRDESIGLPVVIVRPSIVTPAWKEPLPGWTDNLNGPSGGAVGALTGLIRVYKANGDATGDPIPVDFPTNLIIASAWHKASHKSKDISVYNCGTSYLNPITWNHFHILGMKMAKKYPSEKLMWFPSLTVTTNSFAYELQVLIFHYLPAYILDAFTKLRGGKIRLVRLYDKVYRASKYNEFYTCGEWIFHSENLIKLNESMAPIDRQIFGCDVRLIDWSSYIDAYALGIRQFILKESPSTLPLSRRRMLKFYWIRLLFRLTLLLIVVTSIYFIFQHYREVLLDSSFL